MLTITHTMGSTVLNKSCFGSGLLSSLERPLLWKGDEVQRRDQRMGSPGVIMVTGTVQPSNSSCSNCHLVWVADRAGVMGMFHA